VTGHSEEQADWNDVLAGKGDAFGNLFDRHRDRVFRHGCRFVDTREDAEDVLALAFLELWRLRRRVRLVDGSVLPWLLATTTNVALNHRRGVLRYRRFLARLPQANAAEDAAAGSMRVVDVDLDPLLLEEIKHLSATDQRLLALVAFEGFRLREAAAALGLSVDAARSRWQRIRRRLAHRVAATPAIDMAGGT
jgi:RNA polymerase sigma-70 factor (ECF subfamily)